MNNIVDKIYVINMEKDNERLSQFKEQVGNLFKYTLVKGIDPFNDLKYKIKYQEWFDNNKTIVNYENFNWKYYVNRYQDLKNSNIITKKEAWDHWVNFGEKELRSCNPNNDIVNKGQWGCLYSHIKILKHAIKHNYKSILVLEDDIILTKDIELKILSLHNFIEEHPNWNIIYLGASQYNWDDIKIKRNYYNANNTTGSFALIINKNIFKDLLKLYIQMLKPVDNYLIDIQKIYYSSIFVLYPNIFICNLEESNIGSKRSNNEYYKIFRWNIN